MTQGAHNVGVVQVLGKGHLHGGPIWGALYILVLLWCYDLQHQDLTKMAPTTTRSDKDAPQYYKILQGCSSKIKILQCCCRSLSTAQAKQGDMYSVAHCMELIDWVPR